MKFSVGFSVDSLILSLEKKFLENKIQIYHLKPLIFDICFKRNNKNKRS